MRKNNKFKMILPKFGLNLRKWTLKFTNLRSKNTNKAESYFEKTRELTKKGNNKRGLKTINKAIRLLPYYTIHQY